MRKYFVLISLLFFSTIILAQPSNDNCGNAIELTELNNWCYSNQPFAGATFDIADGSCDPIYTNPPNVWFWFLAEDNFVEISAYGPGNDPLKITLISFNAGNCGTPTFLDCDYGDLDFDNLVPGREYYILISKDPAVAEFELCINNQNPDPPVNDESCSPIALVNGVGYCGTTNNANATFAPNDLPCPSLSGADVWFTFTVTAPNNFINLSFSGVTMPGNAQILIGTWNNGCTGTYTYSNTVYCTSLTTHSFSCLDPGTYYIMISTAANQTGDFCITATQSGPPAGCSQNDACSNATPIPISGVGDACANNQCNTGACGEPVGWQGCPLNNAVVWYTFTTGAQNNNLMNISLTGGLVNPEVSVFTGTCNNLNPIILCNPGGASNVIVSANTTYYIAISTDFANTGNFDLCISIFENPSSCTTNSSLEVISTSLGSPFTGPFKEGETVRFRYTISEFQIDPINQGNNCQWLHMMVPVFGKGWDITPGTEPANVSGPNTLFRGPWDWYGEGATVYRAIEHPGVKYFFEDGGMKLCSVLEQNCDGVNLGCQDPVPAGWICSANGPGPAPSFNWGDGAGCGNTVGPWEVEFDLTTVIFEVSSCDDIDPADLDCSVKVFTFADGETGGWGNPNDCTAPQRLACSADIPSIFNGAVRCCQKPEAEGDGEVICSGATTFISLTSDRDPNVRYEWTIGFNGGVQGAGPGSGRFISQTLTNSGTTPRDVLYIVTPIDTTLDCIGLELEILVTVLPELRINLVTDPPEKRGCASTPFTITASPSGGVGTPYTFAWSTGNSTGNSVTVTPGAPGLYQYYVTVTDQNGCSAIAEETIEIFPQIFAELEIEETEFCQEFAPKTLSVLTDPSTNVTRYDWQNPGPPTPTNRSFINVTLSGYYAVTITDDNGCQGQDEIEIIVHPTPNIFVFQMPPDSICVDVDMGDEDFVDFGNFWFDFSSDPTTEIWGGTAEPVQGGRVYPKALMDAYGPGPYTVTLILESPFGCLDSIEHTFELVSPPNLTLFSPPAFCATAPPYVLNALPAGGVWSGPGVANGLFNPLIAGPGTFTLIYEFLQGDCRSIDSMTVVVNEPPVVVISPIDSLCFDDDPIQLIASPTGGIWSGNGIVDPNGIFDPAFSLPGVHTITYTYREASCDFPYTVEVVVFPELLVGFNVANEICLTDESIVTFTGIAPPGTIFSWTIQDGTIVQNDGNGNIRIQWNSSGNKNISLSIRISDCENGPANRTVRVEQPLALPQITCIEQTTTSVTFGWDPIADAGGYIIIHDGNNYNQTGTTFTVDGIDPGNVTQVTITVIAVGTGICGDSDPVTFDCTSLACPNIVLVPDQPEYDLCIYSSGASINLEVDEQGSDGSGTGVWSGNGVSPTGLFDPILSGPGTHVLTYTFVEQQCTYQTNVTARTYQQPVASWDADKFLVCVDEIAEVLFTGTLFQGGNLQWNFDGAEIVSGAGVGPYQLRWATPGIKTITLVIDDGFCISELFNRTIEVERPLDPPLISCESNPVSVRFFWNDVNGANGYIIRINNGAPFTIFDTFYQVDGLNQGDRVTISVIAIGTGVCGNSDEVEFDCEAKECPLISVDISAVNDICLDANAAPVQLQLVIVGSDGSGVGLWNGPGIDASGLFSPAVSGPGTHVIDYRLTEDFCNYFASLVINVYDQPVAIIDLDGPVCIGDLVTVYSTGNHGAGATYSWNVGGGQIITGAGTSQLEVRWQTSGLKNVSLVVTENGCPSETESATIDVEVPLAAPLINCDASTTEIIFYWGSVPGASSYLVSINGQPAFSTTDLQSIVDGLTVGQQATITVIAVGTGPCGNSLPTTLTCEAEPCPLINVDIAPVTFICLSPATAPFNLNVSVTGDVVSGSGMWSGSGIVDNQTGLFDPQLAGIGLVEIVYSYRERACNFYDTIVIDIRPQPVADFIASSPVCTGQIADIIFNGSATGSAVFNWTLDAATIVSGGGSASMEVYWNTPGTKNLRLAVDDNGCLTNPIERQVVVQAPLATPILSCNSTLTSISFSWNNVANNEGYLVSIDGGAPFAWTGTTYDLTNLITGDSVTIVVIAISNGPCGNSDAAELTCYAVDCADVVLTIQPMPVFCLGGTTLPVALTANATNGHGGGTFTWSGPGIINQATGLFDPSAAGPGDHEIFVTYRESVCPYQTSIIFRVVTSPEAEYEFLSPECFGINDGIIRVIETMQGLPPYTYGLNLGPAGAQNVFPGLSPGNYRLIVRDDNGCQNEYNINLIQPDRLVVDLGPDILVDAGDEITLIPTFNIPGTEIVDYLWSGSSGIICPVCPEAVLVLFDQTRIFLEVEDIRGCKASDNVNIVVRKKRRVFIPGSFSPDNNGINDFFTVFAAEEVERVEQMKVFDRWGNMMYLNEDFEPNNETEGWDGTFQGKTLNPSVFVYHIVVRFKDGSTEDFHGDVTLLKN